MTDPATLQAQLREVSATFSHQLPERGEQIAGGWERLKRERCSREALNTLYRMVHNLAGAGGTFGYDAISVMAREMADPLRQLMVTPARQPEAAELQSLDALCERLVTSCRNPAGSRGVPPVRDESRQDEIAAPREGRRPVFLVGGSQHLCALHADLIGTGIEASRVSDADALERALQTGHARALVLDMASLDSAEVVSVLSHLSPRPPLIALAETGAFNPRLVAVRAGMDAFLVVPVSVAMLCERITLLERQCGNDCRVLIVDDDREQARYTSLVLERCGIHTRLLHDPGMLIEQLQDFSPDLLLLDLYMPECSGIELARMVRQYDPFSTLSILFLSVESDRPTQLAALQAGADDFLSKPIAPDDLLAAVRYRLLRGRGLRLMAGS